MENKYYESIRPILQKQWLKDDIRMARLFNEIFKKGDKKMPIQITEVKDGKVVLRDRKEIRKEMDINSIKKREFIINEDEILESGIKLSTENMRQECEFLPYRLKQYTKEIFNTLFSKKTGPYRKMLDRGFMIGKIEGETYKTEDYKTECKVVYSEVPIPLTDKECFGVRLNKWQVQVLESIRRACACNEAKTMMCFKKYLQNNGFLSKE